MRRLSVRWQVMAAALAATAVALVAVMVAAQMMFVSPHDRNLLMVVIGAAFVLGAGVALWVSRSLVADLDRLARASQAVAGGDLQVRTGIDRGDEVGETARAFDDMVERLDLAHRRRAADEAERRLLMASVGHDLRTPLAAIRAATEALQDGVAPDPRRYLGSISRDLDHLTHLVDDLFLLAQIDAGRFEAGRELVDMAELADDAAEALLPTAAAAGVTLRVKARGAVRTRGSAQELSRVIRNVVDNAIRHCPTGGRVTVTVAHEEGRACIRVTDDGPGFPREFTDRACVPFTRADTSRRRATGGAGLGLAIARGVSEAHGGAIRLRPGPGGDVTVLLPTPA
ncbi:MAG TPA: HAMP domain-containing histidine kinase [Acidimicrobiales bacterium]|nr:HAMP domain-containing histidine kinase [Acidimicrobiales bacterium]